MPDPDCERPSYMKRRARQLLFEAARLADASTLGEGQRAEIKRMRSEAKMLDYRSRPAGKAENTKRLFSARLFSLLRLRSLLHDRVFPVVGGSRCVRTLSLILPQAVDGPMKVVCLSHSVPVLLSLQAYRFMPAAKAETIKRLSSPRLFSNLRPRFLWHSVPSALALASRRAWYRRLRAQCPIPAPRAVAGLPMEYLLSRRRLSLSLWRPALRLCRHLLSSSR